MPTQEEIDAVKSMFENEHKYITKFAMTGKLIKELIDDVSYLATRHNIGMELTKAEKIVMELISMVVHLRIQDKVNELEEKFEEREHEELEC